MEGFNGGFDGEITLDTDIYPIESVQLAAYSFMDDAFFYLHGCEPDGRIRTLRVKMKMREAEADPDRLMGEFINELNRESHRIHAARRNRKIRTQVVGRALTSAMPSDRDEEEKQQG